MLDQPDWLAPNRTIRVLDNLSELEVVPNPDQRDVEEWPEESGEDDNDSDEDESCAWLYERW